MSRFLAGAGFGLPRTAPVPAPTPTGVDALLFPLGVLDTTVVASVGDVDGVEGEDEYGE